MNDDLHHSLFGAILGAAGMFLVCVGSNLYSRNLTDGFYSFTGNAVGAALGAAIAVLATSFAAGNERRRERAEDVNQALRQVRSLLDAVTDLRGRTGLDYQSAMNEVSLATQRISAKLADTNLTDHLLRRTMQEAVYAVQQKAALLSHGPLSAPTTAGDRPATINTLLAELNSLKRNYQNARL